MMNKDKILKKRLIKEGIVLGGICGLLLFIAFGISMYAVNVIQQRDSLQSEKGNLTNTLQTMQTQLTKAKVSLELYEAVKKRNPVNGDLNREAGYAMLNGMRDRYYMSKLDVAISPVKDLEDPKYKNASIGIVSCEIKLGFETLSDETAYRFVNAIQKEFPGYLRVIRFNLTRMKGITPEVESAFQSDQVPALVRGEIVMYWLGFKPQGTPAPDAVPGQGS